MVKQASVSETDFNSLPALWVRSMFDLQSVIHANLQRMMPSFIPYPLKQREEACFQELHDDYQNFVIDLVRHWPEFSPWDAFVIKPCKSDCDIIKEATKGKKES